MTSASTQPTDIIHRSPTAGAWAVLGALRFGMAFWVLLAHIRNFGQDVSVPSENALVAVYCFLAISGLSIHHSIDDRPSGYLRRRFWRIAPTHVSSVILALIIYSIWGPVLLDGLGSQWPFPDIEKWIGCLFLLQCLLPVAIAILTPAWSLSIEMVYYAMAPILRRLSTHVLTAIMVLSAVFFMFRPHFSQMYIAADTHGLSATMMIWSWIAGWLVYRRPWDHGFFVACVIAGFACIVVDNGLHGPFNYCIWILVLVAIFYCRALELNAVITRALSYLGEISYPLYMVHYPVFFAIYNSKIETYHGLVFVFAALMVSIAVHHWIDLPLRFGLVTRNGRRVANPAL